MFGDFWPSDFLVGRLAKGDGTGGEGECEGVNAMWRLRRLFRERRSLEIGERRLRE